VTSGGIDSGADPIFERHGGVVEKAREVAGCWKAGRRNEGIEAVEEVLAVVATPWAQRRRTGVNIGAIDGVARWRR
jgi:hypothetical protein